MGGLLTQRELSSCLSVTAALRRVAVMTLVTAKTGEKIVFSVI